MITKGNYFETINKIGFENLSPELQDEHTFVEEATEENTTWKHYDQNKKIRALIDRHFKKLDAYIIQKKKKTSSLKVVHSENTPKNPARINASEAVPVEKIGDEVKFIKRYALMQGKEKSRKEILNFINALQKAILERRIRKVSKYSSEIKYIQETLINLYNSLKNKQIVRIKIDNNVLQKFNKIGGSEKVRLSINYLKRYVGIQGKQVDREKAVRLYNLLTNAVKKRKIDKNDPYAKNLNNIYLSLDHFIKTAKPSEKLEIHENALNGINQALESCNCESLSGFNEPETSFEPSNTIMSSVEFGDMKFESLDIQEPWRSFMGNVSPGFSAMIFAKPKMGKSYLAIDMAGYFARNHGKVLYVGKEEGFNNTLQLKLKDKKVIHSNLDVSNYLPDDLAKYDFIFLDSVNSLGLSPEELRALKASYPKSSFIYIFQSTKEGNFRGANEFQHDVDVVIEVPEIGKAVQFGRFNQGGEMNIFERSSLIPV